MHGTMNVKKKIFTDVIHRKSGVVETVLIEAEAWQCVSKHLLVYCRKENSQYDSVIRSCLRPGIPPVGSQLELHLHKCAFHSESKNCQTYKLELTIRTASTTVHVVFQCG